MTQSLDRLLAVLRAADVRLTPAELAEAIWLATQVDVGATATDRDPAGGGAAKAPPRDGPGTVAADQPDERPGPEETRPGGRRLDLHLPVSPGVDRADPSRPGGIGGTPGGPGAPGTGGSGGGGSVPPPGHGEIGAPGIGETVLGSPLLAPTAGALPRSLEVLRALRPLKRRVLSSHRFEVDEDETARQIAERNVWTPIRRPMPDRWLHLTLVLDHSAVGQVWARLGVELRVLLERLGAFRTMRLVHLSTGPDGTLCVTAPADRDRLRPRSPLTLTERPGDHLLLVLSDCVSDAWHGGEMRRVLGHWARRAPVAILQPLPERLWKRTGLDPIPGRLHGRRAGAPAVEYEFTSWLRRDLPERTVPVPVLEISPDWLRAWARLIAGSAVGGMNAVVTPAAVPETDRTGGDRGPAGGDSGTIDSGTIGGDTTVAGAAIATAEPVRSGPPGPTIGPLQRVREFQADASAGAYQLARYLSAAVPLNLAVMRLVQAVMVPGSGQSQLAEVLFSGLLEPVPGIGGQADDQRFEFVPGVRHVLIGTLRPDQAARVLSEVSGYVERHLEQAGASFAAVVSAPMGSLAMPALQKPFAQIRAEVVRRLLRAVTPEPAATRPASPEPPGPARYRPDPYRQATILHLSGPSLINGGGGDGGDGGGGAGRILEDLDELRRRHGTTPDLIVVTGDLTEHASPSEYKTAYLALKDVRTRLGLPPGRIMVVPGMRDVNDLSCQAYFLSCQAEDMRPVPPYWPKWGPFADLVRRLPGSAFNPDTPWELIEVPELRLVLAGMNSTIAASHRETDRYGSLGEAQLRWFAERMPGYERRGWLRLGVLHHDPAGDDRDGAGLRDADTFTELLASHLDLVLHGRPGGVDEIGVTGVPAVGVTGAPAVGGAGGPASAAASFQLVTLRPGALRVLSRPVGRRGGATSDAVTHGYGDHWWPDVPDAPAAGDGGRVDGASESASADATRTDLVARVARVCGIRSPGGSVTEHRWPGLGTHGGYLLVPAPDRGYDGPACVGVYDGVPTRETVDSFLNDVVRQAGYVGQRPATLVCGEEPDDRTLSEWAIARRVRVIGFADFQLGDELIQYATRQAASLATDSGYPAHSYVSQRHTSIDLGTDPVVPGQAGAGAVPGRQGVGAAPGPDLVGHLRGWLAEPVGQVIAVLGDSGMGKTFLLRELARRLHADRDPVVPILVDLRDVDWGIGADLLITVLLSRGGIRGIDLDHHRHLLSEGRVVLLCDGLDDLIATSGRTRPVSGWELVRQASAGRGKIVFVSRDADLLADVLGQRWAASPAGPSAASPAEPSAEGRAVRLEGFGRRQIMEFLGRRLGSSSLAQTRLDLLERVGGLLGMSRNPRMLAFIAGIDEEHLRAALSGSGPVTVATLYQKLINEWLGVQREQSGGHHLFVRVSLEDIRQVVAFLALRLWESGEPALGADALGAAADVLARLTTRTGGGHDPRGRDDPRGREDQPSRQETARMLGINTLLVRDPDYRFRFVDYSIVEWLVAREFADQLGAGQARGRLPRMLRREMSPLLAEFVCELAGARSARRWAESVLDDASLTSETRVSARQVLNCLEHGRGNAGASPEPGTGGRRP